MKPDYVQKLARLGAVARLQQLEAEIAELRAAFPDLAGAAPARRSRKPRSARPAVRPAVARAPKAAPAARPAAASRRRQLTKSERQAISDRMTRYWSKRRAEKAAAGEGAAPAATPPGPGAAE